MSEIYNKSNLTNFLSSCWDIVYNITEDLSVFYDITLTKLADFFTEAIRIGLSNVADEFAVITKKKWHLFSIKESDIVLIRGHTPHTNIWQCKAPDNIKSTFFLTKNVLNFAECYYSGVYFSLDNGIISFFKHPSEFLNKDVVNGETIYWGWAYNTDIWDDSTVNKWSILLNLYPAKDDTLKYSIIGALHFLVGGPTEKNLISLITGCCGLPVVINPTETVFISSKQELSNGNFNYTIITDSNIYTINNIKQSLVDESKIKHGTVLKWGDVFTKIVKVYTSKDKLKRMIAGYFEGYKTAEGLNITSDITNNNKMFFKEDNVYLRFQYIGSHEYIDSLSRKIGADYTGRVGLLKIGNAEPQEYGATLDAATQFIDECPSIVGLSIHDDYKNKLSNFISVIEEGKPSWSYIIISNADDYTETISNRDLSFTYSRLGSEDVSEIKNNTLNIGDANKIGIYTKALILNNVTVDTGILTCKNFMVSFNGTTDIHALSGYNNTLNQKLIPGKDFHVKRVNKGILTRRFQDIPLTITFKYYSNVINQVKKIDEKHIIVARGLSNNDRFYVDVFDVQKSDVISSKEVLIPQGQRIENLTIEVIDSQQSSYIYIIYGGINYIKIAKFNVSDLFSSDYFISPQLIATIDTWSEPNNQYGGMFTSASNKSEQEIYVLYCKRSYDTTRFEYVCATIRLTDGEIARVPLVANGLVPPDGFLVRRLAIHTSTKGGFKSLASLVWYDDDNEYKFGTFFVNFDDIADTYIESELDDSIGAVYNICSKEADLSVVVYCRKSEPYIAKKMLFKGTQLITSTTEELSSEPVSYDSTAFLFDYYDIDSQTSIYIPFGRDDTGDIYIYAVDQSFFASNVVRIIENLCSPPRMFASFIDGSLVMMINSSEWPSCDTLAKIPLEQSDMLCIGDVDQNSSLSFSFLVTNKQKGDTVSFSIGGSETPGQMVSGSIIDFAVFTRL
ncbi:MAG: hypothetical protein ABIM30_00115 [candidate division WOR-3 bacterium]